MGSCPLGWLVMTQHTLSLLPLAWYSNSSRSPWNAAYFLSESLELWELSLGCGGSPPAWGDGKLLGLSYGSFWHPRILISMKWGCLINVVFFHLSYIQEEFEREKKLSPSIIKQIRGRRVEAWWKWESVVCKCGKDFSKRACENPLWAHPALRSSPLPALVFVVLPF